MPLWHKGYFELLTHKKQQVQEGHSDLLFSFKKQNIKLLYERCPSYTRREETFLSPETESPGQKNSVQIDLSKLIIIFL